MSVPNCDSASAELFLGFNSRPPSHAEVCQTERKRRLTMVVVTDYPGLGAQASRYVGV